MRTLREIHKNLKAKGLKDDKLKDAYKKEIKSELNMGDKRIEMVIELVIMELADMSNDQMKEKSYFYGKSKL